MHRRCRGRAAGAAHVLRTRVHKQAPSLHAASLASQRRLLSATSILYVKSSALIALGGHALYKSHCTLCAAQNVGGAARHARHIIAAGCKGRVSVLESVNGPCAVSSTGPSKPWRINHLLLRGSPAWCLLVDPTPAARGFRCSVVLGRHGALPWRRLGCPCYFLPAARRTRSASRPSAIILLVSLLP